ncbi:MAG TPA: AAA family ATPase [Bacilli bacterium]|nr:AAA family ATPase [Bacilli bacterium]
MSQTIIRNLRIENFQSHALTELAFDDGLNVIVGASDQGKSAVIRALRWLLYNEPRGSDFIRVGATQCRVTVELSDGSKVTRERTPSKNRYIVTKADGDEQIYEGFGNTVPREVSDVTGVAKVMLDEDTETILHLGTQLEPAFMLSEPGSVKAKAIGRLNGVHIIDAASRDTHRDLTRQLQEEKGIKEQLEETEQELEQFSDIPYLENILLLVEEKQARLKDLKSRKERLEILTRKHREVEAALDQTSLILSQTEHLDRAALHVERAVSQQGKALRLNQFRGKLEQNRQGLAQTDNVLQGTAGLEQAATRLQQSETLLGKHHRLARLSTVYGQVVQVKGRLEAVLDRTQHLDEAAGKVARLDATKGHLTSLLALRQKKHDTENLLQKIDHVLVRTQGVPQATGQLEQVVNKRQKALWLREVNGKKQEVERQLQVLGNVLSRLQALDRAEMNLHRLAQLTERQQRLQKIHAGLWDVGDRLGKADVYLKTNALEIQEKLADYEDELKQSGTCPVCFTPIDEHTKARLEEEFTTQGGFAR